MARRAKKADAQPESGVISADDMKRIIKDYSKQVAKAAEYQGVAGQAIKTAIDQFNLDRKAFRFALGLSKMEEQKRQSTLRQLIELAHKAGYFDQTDAFDDILDHFETIIADVRGRSESSGGRRAAIDNPVSQMIQ